MPPKVSFFAAGTQSGVDSSRLKPNTRYTVQIEVTNTGTGVWGCCAPANPLRLGTEGPQNRHSSLYVGTGLNKWLSKGRPTKLDQLTTSTTGTFTFDIIAPATGGARSEKFRLLQENTRWFSGPDIVLSYKVDVPPKTWSYSSPSVQFSDPQAGGFVNRTKLVPSTRYAVTVRVRNSGTETWPCCTGDRVLLGTEAQRNRISDLYLASGSGRWLSGERPAYLAGPADVRPGADGLFEFEIVTPATPGFHSESFRPLQELVRWLAGPDIEIWFITQEQTAPPSPGTPDPPDPDPPDPPDPTPPSPGIPPQVGGVTTSRGYLMVSESGKVHPFGDAQSFGDAVIAVGNRAVDLEDTDDGLGYWVVDNKGNVHAKGSAQSFSTPPASRLARKLPPCPRHRRATVTGCSPTSAESSNTAMPSTSAT